ncbi:MAG TPA: GNAT family N-acetyltransferase [Puia sp.]|nr:GNAT family N-acetyltransferase [Puia sp.]
MNTSATEKISLQTAASGDLSGLAALAGTIFQETYTGMMPEEDLRAYIATAFSGEQIHSEWILPTSHFIIAFCGQALAGYAKISTRRRAERPEPGKYMEIERLYILQKFQGRKIGAALMDACVRLAGDQGFQTIWLNVWEQNTRAIGFYKRREFVLVDWSFFMRGKDRQKGLWMKREF